MASKTSKASSSHSAPAAPALPLAGQDSASFALVQGQMQTLMGLADVVFKGAEEMRRCQLEAAQQARKRHEKAQSDLAAAANPTELLNVQSELLRYDLESAGQYWQRLATICTAAQAEAVNLMTQGAMALGSVAKPPALAREPERASAATDSLDPSQTWNRWVDLGKQWSDMLYRTEAALH